LEVGCPSDPKTEQTVVVPSSLSATTVTRRLALAGCVAAEDEARDLLALARDDETAESWISRREQGEPLAWITGLQEFAGYQLRVDPGVYVPRRQSEELARRAADLLATGDGSAADVCTGSGTIAAYLLAAVPAAHVVGVEIDRSAAECARRNGVPVVVGDLTDPLASSAFGLVTAIAPYVPSDDFRTLPRDVQRYEPRRSLDGGGDGLHLVRRVVTGSARVLRPGGWLLVELGGEQDEVLAPVLADAGFENICTWRDEDGDLRGLAARLRRD
jgi:release factor glutamine methyltransferase